MKKLYNIIIFFYLICSSQNVFCNNIAVIDIEEIINNNRSYIEIIKKIENSQSEGSSFLKDNQLKVEKLFQEIENSRLLLNDNELSILIFEYNTKYDELLKIIKDYNDHYQNEIIQIRKKILQLIIVLSEEYAKKNNIDLILDSTSYLIAANEINITNEIKNEIDNMTIKLEFKSFEKN